MKIRAVLKLFSLFVSGVVIESGIKLYATEDYSRPISKFEEELSDLSGTLQVSVQNKFVTCYIALDQPDTVITDYIKAVDVNPDGAALAYTNLGVLRITQGRYDEAKMLLGTAVRNDTLGQTNVKEYLKT